MRLKVIVDFITMVCEIFQDIIVLTTCINRLLFYPASLQTPIPWICSSKDLASSWSALRAINETLWLCKDTVSSARQGQWPWFCQEMLHNDFDPQFCLEFRLCWKVKGHGHKPASLPYSWGQSWTPPTLSLNSIFSPWVQVRTETNGPCKNHLEL